MKYESKRLTISYPAIERLMEVYGLPTDLPSQTLAGYVERMIFEGILTVPVDYPQSEQQTEPQPQRIKPNINKLAAMAKKS